MTRKISWDTAGVAYEAQAQVAWCASELAGLLPLGTPITID